MAYPAKTDRASILAAALAQVETEGAESLAIRSLATRLGLAPNALYRYFADLSTLEAAVAEEVRAQMLATMQNSIGRKGPAETICSISELYLQFARQRPRAFALYLKNTGVQTPQCARNTAFFVEHVARVYGEERATVAAHILWAQIHGLAVLLGAGVLVQSEAEAQLRFSLEVWLKGAQQSEATNPEKEVS